MVSYFDNPGASATTLVWGTGAILNAATAAKKGFENLVKTSGNAIDVEEKMTLVGYLEWVK